MTKTDANPKISNKIFSESDLQEYCTLSCSEYGDLSPTVNLQHNKWKHVDSPMGASDYISLNHDKNIVGRILVQNQVLMINRDLYRAGLVCDLLIKKSARLTPLNFIRLTKSCDELKDKEIIFHTSNEISEDLYKEIFKYSSPLSLDAYIFPVRIIRIVRSFFLRKTGVKNKNIGSFAKFILIIGRLVVAKLGINIAKSDFLKQELQDLQLSLSKDYGPFFYRSNEYFRWRFELSPLWGANIYRASRGGNFLGYLVLKRQNLNGIEHLTLVDFLINPKSSWVLFLTIRIWLLLQVIELKCDTFSTMINSKSNLSKKLIGFPFIKVPQAFLPHKTPIFIRPINSCERKSEEFIEAHITLADLDYF